MDNTFFAADINDNKTNDGCSNLALEVNDDDDDITLNELEKAKS